MKSLNRKLYLLLFCFIITMFHTQAQNLIPNPSFENRNSCYTDYVGTFGDYGSFNPYPNAPTAKQWYNNVIGTPDYFNVCASTTGAGIGDKLRHVPNNFSGWQYPHTGNAYVGAILWDGIPATGAEYFASKLTTPLIAGHQYHLSFWVSLAETNTTSGSSERSCYAINNIGAHFSQNEIAATTYGVLNYSADVVSPPGVFYSDTANWVKIEGNYTAVGGEQWMTIGNFTPWAMQQKLLVASSLAAGSQAYYYFDDFCLKDIASGIKNSLNKTNCDSTTLSGNPAASMWTWSTGDTSSSINVTQSGTYWVQSFANCQIYIDTFHVNILPKGIPFDLGMDISHCGDTTILLGPTDSTFTSYVWSNGNTDKNIRVNTSGTYYVTATTPCNVYSDTIRVAINPIPPRPNDFDTVMCRQPVRSYQIPVQGQNLIWVETATGFSSQIQPLVDLTVDKDYSFQIFSISNAGCISEPANVRIRVHGEPPEITLRDTATCQSSVNIGMDFGMVDYKWSTGQNTCCINVSETGTYILTVSNQCGQDTAQSKVDIMHCNSCLLVPNAFSPNGDGINDEYKIQKACLLGRFELNIYNRYGQRVYHSEDVSKGWDGTFNGKPCDVGTYFYYISADPSFESKQIMLKGDIELIR